jgi:hypothetical protein
MRTVMILASGVVVAVLAIGAHGLLRVHHHRAGALVTHSVMTHARWHINTRTGEKILHWGKYQQQRQQNVVQFFEGKGHSLKS